MRLKIDKSFEKDTVKLNNSKLLLKIASCIEQIIAAESINSIPHLTKLSGFNIIIELGSAITGLALS